MSRVRVLAAASFAVLPVVSLEAANRFFINDKTVLTGAVGEEVAVRCDNDIVLYGFSYGINYDETKLTVTEVTNAGTAAENADFYDGIIDTDRGLIGFGCVFDTDGNFSTQFLPAGTDQVIGRIIFDVLADSDTTTVLSFESVPTNPNPERPVPNVMTNSDGFSVIPETVNGTLTIVTLAPAITAIEDNCGPPGHIFRVIGENFDRPQLTVRVGGEPADASLLADGMTLEVTAPDLGVTGFVAVEVSTDRGSVEEPQGFRYDRPAPEISTLANNSGSAGDVFTVTGSGLDQPGLTVEVCGAAASVVMQSATSLEIEAPECAASGWAALRICVPSECGGPDLCAEEAMGFFYEGEMRPRFRRGDANADNSIDISDAVFILNWLFTGGADPVCVETADVDDNGATEITDPIALLNALFRGGTPPASPGLECGPDPDGSPDLGCAEYPHC